ncbi:MAG: carboxylating nicotinate-nucleotide diphosphorylase [Leptolinea sp.]|nr:carboxylating nicotinate-nucleotide diphosphorylase [Leptolinea sp.]
MTRSALTITQEIEDCIRHALAEDIGPGDATTNAIVPEEAVMKGRIIAKQDGIIAGLDVSQAVYELVDPGVTFTARVEEGTHVENKALLASVEGPARALLTGERTALNFLGRMSGIATMTRQYMDAIAGTKAVVLDTRKTAPGLRDLDKLAVKRGGGKNHRHALYDMVLIKDNHIDFAGSITKAVEMARSHAGNLQIEVETRTLADVSEALSLGVEWIMLDNMSPDMMREAVEMVNGRAKLEASGNITLETIRPVAETGVDYISVGALTHSVIVFDVSFKYEGK